MRSQLDHWRNLLLVTLVAILCFGGSFTCKGSTHDGDNNGSSASVDAR